MAARFRFAALAAILVAAAVLRFTGLDAGLRHTPFIDEQFFVVSVEGMLERGDLNHGFHMYPGFFFTLLAPVLSFVPRPFGADAYLVARHVVASFGVATVALVYLLGARLGTVRSGLIAAAILAVSPVAVSVAHEVRPDVVLGFFSTLSLLSLSRADGRWKGDALGGVAVGMAAAIKYTGVALAVPYVVRRLTIPENRARGMVLAGTLSLVTYALLSPYSFLHFDEFVAGVMLQKEYHDLVPARGYQTYWMIAGVYLRQVVPSGLGVPATLAALFGLWAARRDWRNLLPLAALPLTMVAILSTAQIHRARYVLAGLGAIAVLAGIGIEAVWKRSRVLGVALCLIVVSVPLVKTTESVAAYTRPGTMDRVLDWTMENLPEGSRIANAYPRMGFGVGRLEVMPVEDWAAMGPRTADHADAAIRLAVDGAEPLPGFVRRFVTRPAHPLEGPPIEVLTRVAPKVETGKMDLRGARLAASENAASLPQLVDDDPGTRWETVETQRPGMWVSVDFKEPTTIERVALVLGRRPNQWGRHTEIDVSLDGRNWTTAKTTPGRAMVPDQVGGDQGHTQVLLLVQPTLASSVRVRLSEPGDPRWGFAEIEIHALAGVK